MTDDLRERFRSLDALEFPHDTGPPEARGLHPVGGSTRARSVGTAAFALVVGATALIVAILAFEGGSDRRPSPPADPADDIETGPGTCDYGPWIEHCPEADWARTVVDVAGLEIIDEQGVLVVGPLEGDEFLFWAMDPTLHEGVEPVTRILDDGVAREVDRVDGVPIYGFRSNARLWLWSHHGLNVWLDGRGSPARPARQDFVALVRASGSVPYASATPAPGVTIPDIVGLTDQEAMRTLDGLGLTWVVAYRTVSGVDPWHVASSDPVAGTRVAPGSSVRVLVATTVTPLPAGAADALDCDSQHREAFGGPDVRIQPGGSAYVSGNLPGIPPLDDVVQVTFEDEMWMGLWHVIRGDSVVAVVHFGSLDGEACQGSGVAGA
jgi:hypothetical protein